MAFLFRIFQRKKKGMLPVKTDAPKVDTVVVFNRDLVVDDNGTNREIMIKYLTMLGIPADTAINGECAIDAAGNENYDVVWLDLRMPGLDGFDTARLLRDEANYTGIIIATTGFADESTKEECLSCGMNDVLPKPFSLKMIKDLRNSFITTGTKTECIKSTII